MMADNFLVRTDCEVRMHCNNLKLSQVPEMDEQMCESPLPTKYVAPKQRRFTTSHRLLLRPLTARSTAPTVPAHY
jgi:hypothetical protein